jgi:SulP family sulfate permease
MAALVAVMIMVSIGTFSWRSVTDLKSHPISTSVVMLATVVVVVATHNLAFGVLTGVLIASLNFATKVARFLAVSSELRKSPGSIRSPGRCSLPPPTALWRILIFAKRRESCH